jgi:DNA-binding winged helix-turn-helix (wHTH) protein/TolB-like protein
MMNSQAASTFEFGAFRLEIAERRLQRNGDTIAVPPKVFDTLVLLVQNPGRLIGKDELMAKLWPSAIVEEVNLARNISDLRKILGDGTNGTRYIETVPKRGYRFVADVRETVPEETAPASAAEPVIAVVPLPSRFRTFSHMAPAALFVAMASMVVWWLAVPGGSPGSLAVLQFRPLDAGSADDSLEVGLTDALITRLSRSLSIPVRPMAAVLRYRDRSEDPLEAGRALRVDAILEGTFQKHDGKIRISVRLLRSRDGKALYAGVFDQGIAELFRLEDAISTELAGALILKLAPERQAVRDPAAYAAYLKGRYYWNQRTRESIHRAIDYFHDAIAADPGDALAYSGLADAYLLLPTYERIPHAVMMPLARAAAERAVQVDGGLAEAHASLGLLAENYDLDWARAEREYRAAVRLNPNYPTGRHWYAEYIGTMGRLAESETEFDRARNLDPLSAAIPADEAKVFWFAHQFEKSAALARQSLTLDPHFTLAHLILGASLVEFGDCSGAVAEAGPAGNLGDSDLVLAVQTFVYARCGSKAEALAVLHRLTGEGRAEGAPFMIAAGYAAVGDGDRAQEWLERTVVEREGGILALRTNLPAFDGIRSGARYQHLLARLHLK